MSTQPAVVSILPRDGTPPPRCIGGGVVVLGDGLSVNLVLLSDPAGWCDHLAAELIGLAVEIRDAAQVSS